MKMFYACLILALPVFAGCSTVTDFLIKQEAPEKVADVVDSYCDEVPAAQRAESRALINAETSPGNTIAITCAGD